DPKPLSSWTRTVTSRLCATAVASSVAVKKKPPSPHAATTRRPGAATAAPLAAPRANPSVAEPHGKIDASGSYTGHRYAVHEFTRAASWVTIASRGRTAL